MSPYEILYLIILLCLSFIKTIFWIKFIIPYDKIVLYINGNKDLNTGFYKDDNFERACSLSEQSFSHEELLKMLSGGNIPEKQIAALKFDYVSSTDDAKILISNLTGCDGKIREAVALKINQLMSNGAKEYFIFPEIMASAAIDINANICRLIVDSAKLLNDNEEFAPKYAEAIIKYILEALDKLDSFIFRDKKYVINKQLFKLYWCLETLKDFHDRIDENLMLDILEKCAEQKEYTIREKTAQIAILSKKYNKIADKLKLDDNYYVKAVFKSS